MVKMKFKKMKRWVKLIIIGTSILLAILLTVVIGRNSNAVKIIKELIRRKDQEIRKDQNEILNLEKEIKEERAKNKSEKEKIRSVYNEKIKKVNSSNLTDDVNWFQNFLSDENK